MKDPQHPGCDDVLAAVMARLDGETPALPADRIDAHLAGCAGCRAAAARMTAQQGQLAALSLAGPGVDLWPAVGRRIGHRSSPRHGWIAFALVAAICLVWRTGQLVLDLPLPVVNTLVPLAVLVPLVRWLVGDPLAFNLTTPDLRQERA